MNNNINGNGICNINGISRKKISENNHKNNVDIKEEYYENNNLEEQYNNKNYNYEDNNDNNSNNNYDDNIKGFIRNNFLNEDGNINNVQEYYSNEARQYNVQNLQNLQRPKLPQNINSLDYDNQDNIGYNFKANGIGYIINQFVNNLSDNIYDPHEMRLKKNKRKNTFESIGEESYLGNENNNNYELINNQNNIGVSKSRKNSIDSINKLIQNDNKDFKELYKKVFGADELNQNKSPFDINDFRNHNILEDDLMNVLNKK